MATFEERILEFLEGERSDSARLDEPSNASLLREVSETEDNRRTFTAFVRLRELLRVAQKPTPAPLAVQRDLAQKLPVLALHLPYLAAVEKRERSAAFWASWSATSRIALSLAVLALFGTAVYLGLRTSRPQLNSISNNNTIGATSHPSPITGDAESTQPVQTPSTTGATGPTHGGSPATLASSEPSKDISRSQRADRVSDQVNDHARLSSRESASNNAGTNGHATSDHAGTSGHAGLSNRDAFGSRSGARDASGVHDHGLMSNDASVGRQGVGSFGTGSNKDSLMETIAPALARSDNSPAAISTEKHDLHPIELPHLNGDASDASTTFGVETAVRMMLLPNVSLASASAAQRFATAGGAEFGLAYWLNADHQFESGLSLGVRAGFLPVAQMQSVTYAEATPGYPLLKRYQRETRLRDTSALVFGPSVGMHLMLAGVQTDARCYVAISSSNVNWMTGLDLRAAYPLTSAFGVTGGIGVDVTSTAAAGATGDLLPSSYTLGVRDIGTSPASLVAPAVSFSLGIVYHP